MNKKKEQNVGAAAAAFEFYFPELARELKAISRRHGEEFASRYGYDLASTIKEILRKPKPRRARGRPSKKMRMADDDHSLLALAIDEMILAYKKAGASDPLDAAIKKATRLEAEEGRPKSIAAVRKYYWLGLRALSDECIDCGGTGRTGRGSTTDPKAKCERCGGSGQRAAAGG